MGEYADEYIDSMIDEMRPWNLGRPTKQYPDPRPKKELECKYCLARPLYWEQILGKWRLHHLDPDTGKYHVHKCEIGPEGIIKYED